MEEELVTASVVSRHFGIPVSTLYYLANSGQVPYHELPPKPWVKRRQLRFKLSEVRAALDKLEASKE
jgi:predicted DNA-binding transcriptional regulator AlpA